MRSTRNRGSTRQHSLVPIAHEPAGLAYYQGDIAIFSVDPIELIAGSLPRKRQRLVEAWAELHAAELLADWKRLMQGRAAEPIELCDEESRMTHAIYRVRGLQIVGPSTLRLQFDDGTHQVIDFQPVLGGEIHRHLRDLALFNQVRIDPEVETVTWPSGADFDPATLHDWPQCAGELVARAQRWERQAA